MTQTVLYIVVGEIAAHDGWIAEVDPSDAWTGSNLEGWNYQDVTGPFGTVLGEYSTREEARACLNKFLECDAAETGRYCYTHNNPRR